MTIVQDDPVPGPYGQQPAPGQAPVVDFGDDGHWPEPGQQPRLTWADTLAWVRQPVVQRVLAGILVAVSVMLAFETVGTQLWYNARQGALTQDFLTGPKHLSSGKAAALLQIPALNLKLTVVEGDGVTQLRGGPGHRRHTPLPGDSGNSIIAGHQARWGAPFHSLGKLQVGDTIVAQKRYGNVVYFRVTKVTKVRGSDASLLQPTTDTRLTLLTASGDLLSGKRTIVVAVAQGSSSSATPFKKGAPRMSAGGPDGGIGSPLIGLVAILFLGGVAVALGPLRARYRLLTAALVLLPFACAGLLALFLQLDAFAPPLH